MAMNVRELMEKLSKLPPDMLVVTEDGEMGYMERFCAGALSARSNAMLF
jgi:hypothetical protein